MSIVAFNASFDDLKMMHRISRKSFYKIPELKKEWIFMNIYYRKIMKIARMMNVVVKLDNLMEIESVYFKMLGEFETWLSKYSECYHFQWFREDLSIMLNALVDYLVFLFPEKEQTFKWIDNYPTVNLSFATKVTLL